jgi:hypothetical protein
MSAALARGMSKGGVLTGVGLAAGLLIFPAIAQCVNPPSDYSPRSLAFTSAVGGLTSQSARCRKGMSGVVSGLRGMSGGGGGGTGVSVCYITVPDNKVSVPLSLCMAQDPRQDPARNPAPSPVWPAARRCMRARRILSQRVLHHFAVASSYALTMSHHS